MTGRNALEEHVVRAEDLVRAALDNWDAGDLKRCSDCGRRLMSAIGEMEAAQSAGPRELAAARGEMAGRVRRMQAEIGRLSRMVDAASAFARGVALLAGEPAPGPATVHEG